MNHCSGCAKNHGVVAAPAVRITVLVFVVAEERAAVAEQFHDDGIRSENILAFVFGQAFEVHALIVQWRVDFQTIFLAGIKVVGAMTGAV